MGPLRIRVIPLGRGYLAESRTPEVTAFGATAEEAAENGRLMAMAVYEAFLEGVYPRTLIVRIDEPGRIAIAMQTIDRPFSLHAAVTEFEDCYFDSQGNGAVVS